MRHTRDGLIGFAPDRQVPGVPMVGPGVAGVEGDGALELRLRHRPIPIVPCLHERVGGMSLGQIIVELQSSQSGGFGLRVGLAGIGIAIEGQQVVAIRQANVR